MKKIKRLTDIVKGLIVIGLISALTPFVIIPILWYVVKVWQIFF
jgi:hypothetical protein